MVTPKDMGNPDKRETVPASVKPPERKLISFRETFNKMTPQEKHEFNKFQADYVQALDIAKPILRVLSKRKELLLQKLIDIDSLLPYFGVSNVLSLVKTREFFLARTSIINFTIVVKGISAKIEEANLEELDILANFMEKNIKAYGKRFWEYRVKMQEKYSNEGKTSA